MYSTLEVVFIAVAALLAGGIASYLFMRWRTPTGPRGEAQLRELQETHQHYRYEVTEHFSKTAEMLGHLANSYREVHNHLAQGAQTLCDPGAVRALRPVADDLSLEQNTVRHDALEPPRDYPLNPDQHADHSDDHREPAPRGFVEPPRY